MTTNYNDKKNKLINNLQDLKIKECVEIKNTNLLIENQKLKEELKEIKNENKYMKKQLDFFRIIDIDDLP